jgi:hypothetical protein
LERQRKIEGLSTSLLNHRDQALSSLAAQFTHPNVCGTVLVITDPNNFPRLKRKQKGVIK